MNRIMQALFYIVLDPCSRKYSEALKIVERPVSKGEPRRQVGGAFFTRRQAVAYRAEEYEQTRTDTRWPCTPLLP